MTMEKYTSKDWAGLSRRARGPRNHRAAKIKARMVQHIQSRDDVTPSAKLVGGLLVRWYNERAGYSWPSRSVLATETGLTQRSIRRATGELHELGIVFKVTGGGWDRGKIRHKSNMYYPAFSLVLESAEKPGNPPEYRDKLSPGSNCPPSKASNRRISAEVRGQIVPLYSDNDIAGATATPAPNGSGSRPATPRKNTKPTRAIPSKMEKIEFFAELGVLAFALGTTPEKFLAAGSGDAGHELDRLCLEYAFPAGRVLSSPLSHNPTRDGAMVCVEVIAGEGIYREKQIGFNMGHEFMNDGSPVYIVFQVSKAVRERVEKDFAEMMAKREY